MPRKIVVPTMSQKSGLVNAAASGRASTLCQLLDISDFNSALREITHRHPLLSIPDPGQVVPGTGHWNIPGELESLGGYGMDHLELAVVIVTFNTRDLVLQCVRSVCEDADRAGRSYRVIV